MTLSKPISKGDDDAKALIIEALGGELTGGFDIDSIYKIGDQYIILEFLKCDTVRPNDSHPRRYWNKNWRKFVSLWDVTKRLNGRLYLVNYEDSRDQFKVIRVLRLDNTGILEEDVHPMNFEEFKAWYKDLNKRALQK